MFVLLFAYVFISEFGSGNCWGRWSPPRIRIEPPRIRIPTPRNPIPRIRIPTPRIRIPTPRIPTPRFRIPRFRFGVFGDMNDVKDNCQAACTTLCITPECNLICKDCDAQQRVTQAEPAPFESDFKVYDINNDDKISLEEFADANYIREHADAEEAFLKADTDKD